MPRPEKHVFICVQNRPPMHPRPACAARGGQEIAEEFYVQLQERQLFEKVMVSTSSCMGPCGAGPTVVVYPEGVMYGGVTKEDVSAIFEEHLQGGKPVERLQIPEEFWG